MTEVANGWRLLGNPWGHGQLWECVDCGAETVTDYYRNPNPEPDPHDCGGDR